MGCTIGIDIGAVSATAAVFVDPGDRRAYPLGRAYRPLPSTAGLAGSIYLSSYYRTRGRPVAAATELLEQLIKAVGAAGVRGVCLTGSGSKLVAAKLNAEVINEFKAIAAGLAASGAGVRTVFEMGGETSKYLRLKPNADGSYGIVDYATNGDCAAGTGSFIDQQAGRLKYAVEDIASIVLAADRAAQIAGRCSVFAKSDMIHAQQKGFAPAEVLRGLCNAVARNFRTAVVKSHPVEAPVAFIGGVAANAAVVRAIREAFELGESGLVVPDGCFAHLPAIGAAVTAARAADVVDLSHMNALRETSDLTAGRCPTSEPLSMDNVILLRDRSASYKLSAGQLRIDAYLGLDVGSVSTNVVVIDDEGRLVKEIYTATRGRPIEVVSEALREIAEELGDRLLVRGVGTTGSGRELIGHLVGADTVNDEITAHKTGATYVGRTLLGGRTPDTIFEIGGQDSKYILVQDGVVVDFTMNDACAAGTGSFLEERAEELDISIKGEFADLALASKAPIRLGERCTVFMERDVNSYLQRGARKEDLVAGLAYSVVHNYINRVVRGRPVGQTVFFQGGTAYNDAVAAAFSAVTGKEIIVPPYNGVIGAIGAALLASEKMAADAPVDESLGTYVSEAPERPGPAGRRSRFRGYDLSRVDYKLREFTCSGCSNACQVQQFTVAGEKTYWGDKCSDRYRKPVPAARRPVIDDLFAMRAERLRDESTLPPVPARAPTVGIPRTMFAMEQLPFWRTLLAECGLRTVLSEPTNKTIVQAGLDTAVAEPCFPIIAAHGHVLSLARREDVDHVLLPTIITLESRWKDENAYLCPWHQTLALVARRAPALAEVADKFLSPLVYFGDGRDAVRRILWKMLRPFGVRRGSFNRAVTSAYVAQTNFRADLLAAGRRALKTLTETGEPGIVLIGRPYNLHDAGMNLSVASKLRDSYGINCIPMDFLDTAPVDIRDVHGHMYWELGRRSLAAARIVGRHRNLHIIYITNFKCGPDSFITHFIRKASGKPFLTLQFDGHSNDAGIMTRCQAYLDSKGILRPWRREQPAPDAPPVPSAV